MSQQKYTPWQILKILVCSLLMAGCAGLHAPQAEAPHIYVLDARAAVKPPQIKRDVVLAVSLPRARAGFDTSQIAYLRKPHELNYYTVNRWADAPARMLEPLLIQALEQSLGFQAVVRASGIVTANIRLDTELIRLQQDFATQPSRIQLTLRAQLIDTASKQVLAVKIFDDEETTTTDNAYGGVLATNLLLQRMLGQVADFCISESIVHGLKK